VIFGGGKDIHFYKEISDLIDDVRISRQTVNDGPGGIGTSRSGEDVRVLRPGDIRRIQERHALVVAGNAPPIIAKLRRCFDGKDGRALKDELDDARTRVNSTRAAVPDMSQRTAAALAYARDNRLTASDQAGLIPAAGPLDSRAAGGLSYGGGSEERTW
jgi:type IV secretion system protein VirD4